MAKYNIPADHVIRHYDMTGKICPNPYAYNHTQHTWEDFKAALVTEEKKSGWVQVIDGWVYYNGDTGLPVRNDWVRVDGKWYIGSMEVESWSLIHGTNITAHGITWGRTGLCVSRNLLRIPERFMRSTQTVR